MKRVLYILRYYPTLSETFVYREISELIKRGVFVEILALGSREDGSLQDQLPDVVVHRLERGLQGLIERIATATRTSSELRPWAKARLSLKTRLRIRGMASRLGGNRYDRIHAHFAGEAGEWARALSECWSVSYSVTVHANDLFRPRISLGEVVAAARPVISIASSHQRLLNRCFEIEAKLVRTGVPAELLRVKPKRSTEDFHIVSVGRWVDKKGLDTVVAAFKLLDFPARLSLVSDAPADVETENISIGFRPPSEIPKLLATADIFALPCRVAPDGDRDGVPVAILEAMACGVPVVSTEVSGISEVVDSEVGWTVLEDDHVALASVFLTAYSRSDERWRRGDSARERVVARRYTIEAQVADLLACWGWT